jgi:hypothetical protein
MFIIDPRGADPAQLDRVLRAVRSFPEVGFLFRLWSRLCTRFQSER